jgi:hypothetical protein
MYTVILEKELKDEAMSLGNIIYKFTRVEVTEKEIEQLIKFGFLAVNLPAKKVIKEKVLLGYNESEPAVLEDANIELLIPAHRIAYIKKH